jgi:hypothetical protein
MILIAGAALAAPPPPHYHLRLEANPGAPFPFLGKFGTVTIDVYQRGVRVDTFWLSGFSVHQTRTVTVENPLARMYTNVPITSVASMIRKLGAEPQAVGQPPTVLAPARGTVRGISATRYRLQYGPEAWIDFWTTDVIPDSPQMHLLRQQILEGISPGTASATNAIPGVPLYVELNFRRFRKLPLLRTKSLVFDSKGEDDALKTGAFYFRAPLLDAIWK